LISTRVLAVNFPAKVYFITHHEEFKGWVHEAADLLPAYPTNMVRNIWMRAGIRLLKYNNTFRG
jgi:hypothetical protein